ncbi:hypothetical protein Scep_005818 [Stephania cephalantha]|uniref:Uncharacterized protein n=1 Tax=Stephania cephalantha TaxID=152367 RepID=A0AAP0KWS6_9MAGN
MQRGEPSRRRTASRGISSEFHTFRSTAQETSDSDKIPYDSPKSPVAFEGASNHSKSVQIISGSSSNQVSEDSGAKTALQVAMHISPEINAAFSNNILLGLDLIRPYTVSNRNEIPNSGPLFADLLAQTQQILAEPILDILPQVMPPNTTHTLNIVVLSDESSNLVRVAHKQNNWKQRARETFATAGRENHDVEIEQAFPYKRKWDSKPNEDPVCWKICNQDFH